MASLGANAVFTVRFEVAPRSVRGLVRRGEQAEYLRVDGRSNPQPDREGFDPIGAVSRGVGRGRREQRFAAASQQGELSSHASLRAWPFITATDSSAVGQWRVTNASGEAARFSSSDDGRTSLARVSQGLHRAGDSSQSIPRMESAGGA